jgi:hypothetical protein
LLTFSKRFNTGYKQYIANFKGNFDNNDDNDLKGAFKTLLVDYKDNSSNKEGLTNSLAPSFFISIESFTTKLLVAPFIVIPYAKTLVDNLNN